ncbi:MAG: hypothetical protein ACJ762_18635 [Solirubrobacteraceae bacterium]
MTVLGIGTATGLVFALPVKTGSAACPPAGEGRVNCLLQHAWAPAFVKLTAAVLVVWVLAGLLARIPELRRRWRGGERIARQPLDRGRDAVLADSVLNAATWGIVPEADKPGWKVVKPEPNPALARLLARAAAAEEAPSAAVPEPVAVAVPAPVASVPVSGVRALGPAERFARAASNGMRLHILSDDESRTRRLRRGNDPALVVSCWSDASSARELPDDASARTTSAVPA